MDHGVILVTLNYRLGPLGFLSLGEDVLPGNQGMWDLVLASKFINNNIQHFGGNPDRVTLFGQSAGSMAAQLLLLSGQVAGLFQGAILQSGPILSAFAHSDKNPAYYARTFADTVGCDPTETSEKVLECLQAVDVEKIVQNIRIFDHEDDVVRNAPSPWKPVFDGYFVSSVVPFLPDDPLDLLESGKISDIPILIGHTKDEGLYAVTEMIARTPSAADIIFDDWPHKKGPGYIFGREEDEIDDADVEVAEEYLKLFLENGGTRDPKILQNWFSHSIWTAATIKTTELMVAGKRTPTYQYYYTYPGSLSLSDLLSAPLWKLILKALAAKMDVDLFPNSLNGATHFDEIFLLFKGRNIPFLQRHTSSDQLVSDTMLKLWTNFAKTTNPVIDQHTFRWEPYTLETRKHLEIGSGVPAMQDPEVFAPVVEFWRKVWEKVPPTLHLWRSHTWQDRALYRVRHSHTEL